MHVNLVFVTQCRREVFTKEILDDLRPMLASVCTDFEAQLAEFDGEDDHVHLLVNNPPKVSVSSLVNSLRGVSCRMILKKTIRISAKNFGAMRSGRRITLPVAAVVGLLPLSGSTSSSNRRRTRRVVRTLDHASKGELFCATDYQRMKLDLFTKLQIPLTIISRQSHCLRQKLKSKPMHIPMPSAGNRYGAQSSV